MAEYIETSIIERIMSAVESADVGIAFFVENDICIVYDAQITSPDEFAEWFNGAPTQDNIPDDLEGGVLAVIPYVTREVAD